eukprot:gene6510-10518_t
MKTLMEISSLLSHSGFGTKKECQKIIINGRFKLNKKLLKIPSKKIDTTQEQILEIDGIEYPLEKEVHIFMNKPKNIECSHQPFELYKSVFSLLPERFLKRKIPIKCAGRLDVNTTGLLFLSTNGHLINEFQNQKISKLYRVGLRHKFTEEMKKSLENGVTLNDDKFVSCLKIDQIDDKIIEMEINQGLYHQVKRMIGAIGNKVEELERVAIGNVKLSDLMLKQSEWKTIKEIQW